MTMSDTNTESVDAADLDFSDLPPFPKSVDTVPLLRIRLADLLSSSRAEEEKLWRACCDLGFFYLDLRGGDNGKEQSTTTSDEVTGSQGPALLSAADKLFGIAGDIFSLPAKEKESYDFAAKESTYFGYRSLGGGVVDKEGTRDTSEFWNISKDDILGVEGSGGTLENPGILTNEVNRELIRDFMKRSHEVVSLILERLNGRLGLPEGRLGGLHRLEKPSGDQVRWVRTPPQPVDEHKIALGAHTDFGSVTILFNRLGGLQVLPPNSDTWAYVKPLNGHCIVNLGDAMVKFTAGILRSNIHRVVNPPGDQQGHTRTSLVYFNRPEDSVILKTLEGSKMIDEARDNDAAESSEQGGEEITAKEWTLRRALNRRVGGDWDKGTGTEGERLERANHAVEAAY